MLAEFFRRNFAPSTAGTPIIVEAKEPEPTPRDIILALLYRELRDRCDDWTLISSHSEARKKLKLKGAHDHLYNKTHNIVISCFKDPYAFVYQSKDEPSSFCTIDSDIEISYNEWSALLETWQGARQNKQMNELIKKLRSIHEKRTKELSSEVKYVPAQVKALPKYEDALEVTRFDDDRKVLLPTFSTESWNQRNRYRDL